MLSKKEYKTNMLNNFFKFTLSKEITWVLKVFKLIFLVNKNLQLFTISFVSFAKTPRVIILAPIENNGPL